VRHIGSSVVTPQTTLDIVNGGNAEAIQLPTSVIDYRFMRLGVGKAAAKHGVALFVRSVYLQGLILMAEAEVPAELAAIIPPRRRLQAIAEQAGMTMTELAVRYVLGLEGVACGLTGVETVAQMRENIALFSKGPLPSDMMQAVDAAVPSIPDNIVMPYTWSMRMPDAKPIGKK
jgi:aryl-alcohol dehydrogenase-like predicted oxidoreductase